MRRDRRWSGRGLTARGSTRRGMDHASHAVSRSCPELPTLGSSLISKATRSTSRVEWRGPHCPRLARPRSSCS
eukprot:6745912-Pyramimonas_sp.AAC.1